ncbi:lysophospholipid acyltransferase family protein [Thermodesulforhabdus norvegica]|uniref:1-acyl-sn-glycerol-3-phosphate acyltransferase n=1 Tax=Thermodesulforhabdus norvegica TaxID=39841 RepID=A0A1I4VAC1_9BACT|nr:lysophospholipid acyltransferase family protein [Thermodesulforhabdus norvegica]SFM98147.1 1-acyl-sn-glycerol-3-phosphate acyltransferase [Thermodesulforhabdus norvegica]
MKIYIRTAIFYFVLVVSTIVLGVSALIVLFTTKNANLGHWHARLWGFIQLKAAGVRTIVRGREKIDTSRPYVYMPNHQSWFDIFVLLAHIPGQFRWLAKEELYRIPILGPAMRRIGYIPIDRSNRAKAIRSLEKAAEKIKEGTSVVIFPEGTRSPNGILLPFKKGGFMLAIQSGQPIVPISISGSYHVLPKGKWLIRPGTVTVTIHDPIATEEFDKSNRDSLMEKVRKAILSGLTPEEQGLKKAA